VLLRRPDISAAEHRSSTIIACLCFVSARHPLQNLLRRFPWRGAEEVVVGAAIQFRPAGNGFVNNIGRG
jgi:hypothetical protein